ncbi:hypothetical protein RB594_002862 [Gaeumannomyces avenae]
MGYLTRSILLSAIYIGSLVLPAATSPHHATGYDYGFDTAPLVKRQGPQEPFVVKGAGRPNSTVMPLRPEIRNLEKDKEKWTLYILGLSMMAFKDQDDPLSWYSIAGIHGVPFMPWNGVKPAPGSENTGYCTHESILFPTWHRPYLALYEQILYDDIQSIASWFKDDGTRKRFQAAAADFRIPYWDWASNPPSGESLLPLSVGGSPWIDVAGPNGVQRISNPLYMYSFRPLNASAFWMAPWDFWGATLRSPSSNTPQALSNNTKVAMALDQNHATIQQRVYALFSSYGNYSAFSNEAWYSKGDIKHDSIESVHDAIHSLGGLGGHMTYIPFSSFDPLFWLHHTNLDRLFAMWQTIHPESWITPQPARMASYTTLAGQMVDSNTALTPFYATDDGLFWDSNMVRDPTIFNYNYADTVGQIFKLLPGSQPPGASAQGRVKAAINKLYGDSSPARLRFSAPRTRREAARPRAATVPAPKGNAWWDSDSPDPAPGTVLRGGKAYRDWVINVRAEKQALGGTYFIHVFGGDPPADADLWVSAQNLVGTLSVFASPVMDGGRKTSNLVSGTIPLTSFLTSRVVAGELSSLEIAAVEPYLRDKMRYRVILASGAAVDPLAVAGLHMGVASSEVQAPASEFDLPRWGEPIQHFDLSLSDG